MASFISPKRRRSPAFAEEITLPQIKARFRFQEMTSNRVELAADEETRLNAVKKGASNSEQAKKLA